MATRLKYILPLLFCLFSTGMRYTEIQWELKIDKEGIKIFTGKSSNSKFKSVKVECTVAANPYEFLHFLTDINKLPEWVYNCKHSELLKKTTDRDLLFYSEVKLPWPFSNRDYIAHLHAILRSSQILEIESHAESSFIPEKKGIVRITSSNSHWIITNLQNGQLMIEYTVQFDPGGTVPAWLSNLFLTKGPFETFQKLKDHFKARKQ